MIKKYEAEEEIRRRKFFHDLRERRRFFEEQLKGIGNNVEEAYRMLGLEVHKPLTLASLQKAYRMAALRWHPDRSGGSKVQFQRLTKAFMLLVEKFKKEHHEHRTLEEVKQERAVHPTPPTTTTMFKGAGESFDKQKFNKIYEENRLYDVYDDGYGDWLRKDKEDSKASSPPPEIFGDEFNLNVFNTMFDGVKAQQQQHIIRVHHPQGISDTSSSSFQMYGQDTVADYSGSTGLLGFSDLKMAHTTNSTLPVSPQIARPDSYAGLDDIKARREATNFSITATDRERINDYESRHRVMEEQRQQRAMNHQKLIENHHQKLQGFFLTR